MKKLIILSVIFLISCNTFKVYKDDPCQECNDFYSVMSLLASQKSKDNSLAVTIYQECKKARSAKRQELREQHCKKLFFGEKPIDKENYKQYTGYLECIKN